MNFSKFLLSVISVIVVSLSTLTVSAEQPNKDVQYFSQTPSNYFEYLYIDGILWEFEYDNDGKLVMSRIVDID